MDERLCEEKQKRLNERINTNECRLNVHSVRIDRMENDIIAQKKDTTHLQEAIRSLQVSIDLLITEIGGLKTRPLETYEKIGMTVITLTIGYLVAKWFQ